MEFLHTNTQVNSSITTLQTERCYHVEMNGSGGDGTEGIFPSTEEILQWIFKHPQHEGGLTRNTSLANANDGSFIIEIGPRFNFSTAQSTNSVSICRNVGLTIIDRIEVSVKYLITVTKPLEGNAAAVDAIFNVLGDKMTECRYTVANMPKSSFNEQLPQHNEEWFTVPVLAQGRRAIEDVNRKLGLSFDAWDLDYYTQLYRDVLKRDATSVELFDCAQSNSEHSRHWFFKGLMVIDGVAQEKSLIRMIVDTQAHSNANNTISFSDNSSAIVGYRHQALRPESATAPAAVHVRPVESDLIFTAETHNMPTAVAPFSGATTGTGGRIRDVQGVGRGGHTIAGTAGYCVGNLNIPGIFFKMK